MRMRLGIAAALGAAVACAGSASGALPRLLLPDLDQRPPLAVSARWGGSAADPHVLLAFSSSVENIGYGPLIVEGHRTSSGAPRMGVEQFIRLRGGGFKRVIGVGRLRYNVDPSHSHWHLQPFEQYELRTLAGRRIGRDHKSGFCLTSDHRSPLPTLGPRGTHPVDRTHCAKDRPRARHVREGIAVGWGDIYIPAKEGQYVDITGLAPGVYDLVHRVNVGRLLRETNYANNASSMRIRLLAPSTPNDLPGVLVLAICETGTHC
jgi:hypothetical protein